MLVFKKIFKNKKFEIMKLAFFSLIAILFSVQFAIAQRTITGTVTDSETGDPLIGANVLVSGTTTGTVTDIDGFFSLQVGDDVESLEISYTGYTLQNVSIAGGLDKLTVHLESGQVLEEVVVTGYAVEKKKDLLGAVGVMDVGDIKELATPNVLQSMQGRLPGVFVDVSGDPGQGARVRIRGVSTLGNNDPLYIVDGVPLQPFETNELGTGDEQVFGLAWLNPNDIESVQVLKDASAATIYGARASNGVVVITTKRANNKKSTITLNVRTTVENWSDFDDVTNNRQRAMVEWQGAVNDGSDPNATGIYTYEWHFDPSLGAGVQGNGVPVLDKIIFPDWLDEADMERPSGHAQSVFGGDINKGTDWWDEVSRTGVTQDYDISFSQGGERGGVRFGVDYFKQRAVVIGTGYRRIGVRINSNYNFLDGRITIGENLNVTTGKRKLLDTGFGGKPDELPLRVKSIIPVRTEDGRFAGPPGGGFADRDNPVALAFDNRDDVLFNVKGVGNLYAEVKIIKGLSFRTNFGVDYDNINTKDIFRTYRRGFLKNEIAELQRRQTDRINWVFNNTLTYSRDFGKHTITAFAGTESVKNNENIFSGFAKDFAQETNAYFQLDAAAGERSSTGSSTGFSLFSYFGKLSYDFNDKYLLSATFRRDGSSRFGLNDRFAVFPAFSGGWRLSEEGFLKDSKFISNLKLRASWGKTGNQNILNSARFNLFQAIYAPQSNILPWGGGCAQSLCQDAATAYDIGNNDSGILPSGFVAIQTGNDDLKWETTAEFNFGMDLGLFNDRITGTFEVFNKKTKDILIVRKTVGAFGDGAQRFVNGANMRTNGWELALQYNSRPGRDLTFSVGATFSAYDANITFVPEDLFASFPGNEEQNIIGHAPNALFGYRTSGIFQNQAEVDAHAEQTGKRVGALRFVDLNNDGVINTLDQEYGKDNGVPDLDMGYNIQVNWKNFDLSMFFQAEVGRRIPADVIRMENGSLINGENGGINQLNAWSFTNTGSFIPAASNSLQPFGFSLDYNVRNGNYLVFRQITLGYTFPQTLIKSVFSGLRVYVTGENLLWIVDRSGSNRWPSSGWSIESRINGKFPKPQKFSIGLSASF